MWLVSMIHYLQMRCQEDSIDSRMLIDAKQTYQDLMHILGFQTVIEYIFIKVVNFDLLINKDT